MGAVWSMLQQERTAVLLLVDFWNQAVRPLPAAVRVRRVPCPLRALIGRAVEDLVHATRSELALAGDQATTAVIALTDRLAIEGLADWQAAPDDLFAHAIAAVIVGFSRHAGGRDSVSRPSRARP
jgi:hypothetical protein